MAMASTESSPYTSPLKASTHSTPTDTKYELSNAEDSPEVAPVLLSKQQSNADHHVR